MQTRMTTVSLLILVFFAVSQIGGATQVFAGDRSAENASYYEEPVDTIEQWLTEGFEYWNQIGDVPSLISYYAERQLGITYVGGQLDVADEEQLVITLDGSDCVLYVETSLALAMATLQGQTSYDAFRDNIKFIRYREGKVEGYESRLHYFSDWLMTNQEKGYLSILFQEEGFPEIGTVNFMTENRDSYRHIADDEEMYRKIRRTEDLLAERELRYIPEEKIPEYEADFKTGDVLAFVTSIDGLDITHTALVKMDGEQAGFYHASLTGSVIVDPKTIYEYTRDRGNVKGIIIARLKSPQM